MEVIEEYCNNYHKEKPNTNNSEDYSKGASKISNNNSEAKAKDINSCLIKDNYKKRIEEQKVFCSCKLHVK